MQGIINRYDTAIWIRVIGTILTTFGGFMVRPFLALYLYDRLDNNLILTCLIVGLQPLVGLVAGVWSGSLSDRFGRKPMMMIAMIVQAVSMLGYIWADSLWMFAILTILNGVGQALYWPAASAQITDIVPEEKRAEVFALMHTALNVGAALGPLTGVMIYKMNPSIAFTFCAVAEIIYLALLVWKVPETLPKEMRGRKRKDGTVERVSLPKFVLREHKLLIWMTLSMVPCAMLYSQTETILPQHLKTNFEDYLETFALLLTINGTMVVLCQILIARFADRFPTQKVVSLAFLFLSATALGYGWGDAFWLLVVAEILFTIGEMLNGPQIQKAISIMAPPEQRGRYFAIFGAHYSVTGTLAPMLGAYAFQQIGGSYWFTIISVLLLVSAIALYRLIGRAEKKAPVAETAVGAHATS